VNQITPWRGAGVFKNKSFICIETRSGYSAAIADADSPLHFLDAGAEAVDLGQSLLDALARSRFVTPADREKYPQFFDFRLVQANYAKWVAELLIRYGYKTKRDLFRNMTSCGIEETAGTITLIPTKHVKLEAWEGIGAEANMKIPSSSSVIDLGSALEIALSRCI
jgi:CDI immunity protein